MRKAIATIPSKTLANGFEKIRATKYSIIDVIHPCNIKNINSQYIIDSKCTRSLLEEGLNSSTLP